MQVVSTQPNETTCARMKPLGVLPVFLALNEKRGPDRHASGRLEGGIALRSSQLSLVRC